MNTRRRAPDPGRVLARVSGWVFAAGISAAALLYALAPAPTSPEPGASAPGSAVVGVNARDSKQYHSDVANVGGEEAVLTDRMQAWLGDAWHGRRLAIVLAVATLVVSAVCSVLARLRSTRGGAGRSE